MARAADDGPPGRAGGRHAGRARRGGRRLPRARRAARRCGASRRPTRSAEVLGVHRVEFLGYVDSGMIGTADNDEPGSFWTGRRRGGRRAAGRRSSREEEADVLTTYDDDGDYGHPDHIQVHRVGRAGGRAGRHAPGLRVDDQPRPRRRADGRTAGRWRASTSPDGGPDGLRRRPFGMPEARHHHRGRRRRVHRPKRASMRPTPARSPRTRCFLKMPDDAFTDRLRHRVVHPPGAPPAIGATTCSSSLIPMPMLDPHRLRPAARVRRRARCAGSPSSLRTIGVRRVLLVTTAGRTASDDGSGVVAPLGRVAGVDVRRGRVARARAARAAGGAAGAARRRRRRRVVRRRLVRRPGQGGVLLRRAGGGDSRAPRSPTARRCRTSRSRPPTRAPSSRRSSA